MPELIISFVLINLFIRQRTELNISHSSYPQHVDSYCKTPLTYTPQKLTEKIFGGGDKVSKQNQTKRNQLHINKNDKVKGNHKCITKIIDKWSLDN